MSLGVRHAVCVSATLVSAAKVMFCIQCCLVCCLLLCSRLGRLHLSIFWAYVKFSYGTDHIAHLTSCYSLTSWNSLPDLVTSAPSVAVFQSRLKTHLFNISYSSPLWLYSACAVTFSCFGHHNRSCLLTYLLTTVTHNNRSWQKQPSSSTSELLMGLQVTRPKGRWSDIYVECNDQVNIITW